MLEILATKRTIVKSNKESKLITPAGMFNRLIETLDNVKVNFDLFNELTKDISLMLKYVPEYLLTMIDIQIFRTFGVVLMSLVTVYTHQ